MIVHAVGMEFTASPTVIQVSSPTAGDPISNTNSFFYEPNEFHVLQLSRALEAGSKYRLRYEFRASLSDSLAGFYRSSYKTATGETRCV